MRKGVKMNKRVIEDKVSGLLGDFGYKDGEDVYIDICKFALSWKIRVGESKKLDFVDDGFISLSKSENDCIIGVNNARTLEEKRFIVAHELAHFFLHKEQLKEAVMLRENIKGKVDGENDADYFAMCILMPTQSFQMQYIMLKRNSISEADIIDKLQDLFKTPRESIKRRVEEVCR